MENKSLHIEQAVEGEAINVKDIHTFDDFKKELTINGVNDIFSDVKIKQDKNKYIFSKNNENIFAIDGKINLVSWLQKYYEERAIAEKRTAEQRVLIRIEWLEIQYIKTKTTEELNLLKSDITKADNLETEATNIDNVKYKLERNITLLEQEKADINKRDKDSKIEKNLWKAYKSQIQERLDRLYKMKEEIELLEKNKDKKYTIDRENVNGKKEFKEVKMDDVNGMDMKMTLKTISERLETIGENDPDFINTRNSIIGKEATITPYYEIIIKDKKDAKDMKKALNKYNKQYVLLDKISLDAAKKTEVAKDLEKLEEYLNTVIANPETFKPSEHPFVPTHPNDFYALVKQDETLSSLLSFNKTKTEVSTNNAPATAPGAAWAETDNTNTGDEKDKKSKEYTPSQYTDAKEAFEKWGINGISKYRLDQTNMKPEQKQFWSGVGNLAITGGAIFLGWKMISSAFKMIFKSDKATKKGIYDSSNRAWLGIPTALLFWAQARTGKGLWSLFTWGGVSEKIANLFSWGSDDENNEDVNQTDVYREWFVGLMWVFGWMTYEWMSYVLEKTSSGKMKIKEDQYDNFIKTLESGNDKQKEWAKFLKKHVGKEDKNGWLDLSLRSMGITSLEDLTKDPKKEFSESISKSTVRLYSVGKFMEDKWYARINPETMPLITKYIADPSGTEADLEKLAKRWDVFETEEAVTDKTKLVDKVKAIAKTDTEKERLILNGLNKFYDYRPNTDKTTLDIVGEWPTIEFKTYEYSTKINIDTKRIDGLYTDDKFDSYLEMFKAANLTNYIKNICKDKTANSEKPFTISTVGRDIEFDDAKVFSTSFDTEIVSAGPWWSLEDISPTLEKFKQKYCDYLNTITPKIWKETVA